MKVASCPSSTRCPARRASALSSIKNLTLGGRRPCRASTHRPSAATLQMAVGLSEAGLNVVSSQVRERLKEIVQVRVLGEMLDYSFHRNPRSLDDGFAHHDGRILNDSI